MTMIGLKEYFTDGILQVAIVLSLLRTELDIYFGTRYYNRQSELQSIILGPHYGFTQTDIHSYNRWQDEYIHPKSHDLFRTEDILNDLHSLADYRRFDGIQTDLNAWLVNGPESVLPAQTAQVAEVPHAVNITSNVMNSIGSLGQNAAVVQAGQAASEARVVDDAPGFSEYFGSELTKEDMDLIDILWRQDIDLGVSRNSFDTSQLHSQLSDIEGDKQNETMKIENVVQTDDLKNDSYQQIAQSLVNDSSQFAVDNETGELVPVSLTVSADEVTELLEQLSAEQLIDSSLTLDQVNQNNALNTSQNTQFQTLLNQFQGVANSTSVDSRGTSTPLDESLRQLLTRSNSLEQSWQDVLSLLGEDVVRGNDFTDDPSPDVLVNRNPSVSSHSEIDSGFVQLSPRQSVISQDLMQYSPIIDYGYRYGHEHMDVEQPINSMLFHNVSLAATNQLNDSFLLPRNISMPPLSPHIDNGFENMSHSLPLSPVFNLSQSNNFTNPTSLLSSYSQQLINSSSYYAAATNNLTSSLSSLSEVINSTQPINQLALMPYTNNDSFIQQLLQNDLSDLNFDNSFDEDMTELNYDGLNENWSTDSAVSSLPSPSALCGSTSLKDQLSPADVLDVLEGGATGGKDVPKYADEEFFSKYDSDYSSSSPGLHTNASGASNSTPHKRPYAVASPKHVFHNHTYNLQPGQLSREEKEAELKREKEEKATRSRDTKRAKALKLPFTVEEIIYLPVDQFTEMVGRYTLSDAQHQLVRDIRRRGKNKAAAQNCRKRKLEVIQSLEEEVQQLVQERDALRRDRVKLDSESEQMKQKFAKLQAELLRSLRDTSGQSYDPNEFTLQRTSDGDIILVPRDCSAANGFTSAVSDSNNDDKSGRKRKPKKKE